MWPVKVWSLSLLHIISWSYLGCSSGNSEEAEALNEAADTNLVESTPMARQAGMNSTHKCMCVYLMLGMKRAVCYAFGLTDCICLAYQTQTLNCVCDSPVSYHGWMSWPAAPPCHTCVCVCVCVRLITLLHPSMDNLHMYLYLLRRSFFEWLLTIKFGHQLDLFETKMLILSLCGSISRLRFPEQLLSFLISFNLRFFTQRAFKKQNEIYSDLKSQRIEVTKDNL